MELISLLKVYGLNSLGINKVIKEKNPKKKRSMIILSMVIVFTFVVFGLYVFGYSIGVLSFLPNKQLFLPLINMISAIIIIFTVIYLVKGVVVGFQDYQFQMSLPIDNKTIITARLVILYLYSLLIATIVVLPANIAYIIIAKPTLEFYPLAIVLFFFIPIIPLIIGILLGLLIQIPLMKYRFGNFIILAINILAISAITILSFSTTIKVGNDIFKEIATIIESVTSFYPVGIIYMKALTGSIFNFFIFIILSILVFLLFLYIFSIGFKKMNSSLLTSTSKGNYKVNNLQSSSIFIAIFKKEMKKYFNSSLYLFNTSFGPIFMVIMAISILFLGEKQLMSIIGNNELFQLMKSFIPFLLAIFVSLTAISCSAISMEGKNLWIMKSLPVKVIKIFNGIIAVNLIMIVPAAIVSGILLIIALKLNLVMSILTIIVPIIYGFFISIIGVYINIKFPKIHWKSEAEVVKQSIASFIGIFAGLISVIIPAIIMMVVPKNLMEIVIIISMIILIFITIGMYKYLSGDLFEKIYIRIE